MEDVEGGESTGGVQESHRDEEAFELGTEG